jgi:hypothetical protein
MKDKLSVEIYKDFEVEMRGEVPERDECRKKIKKRKLGLENEDFRDSWVAVEDQRIQKRQKSDSEDEAEMEEEGVHRKRKRQSNNNKHKSKMTTYT